MPSTVGALAAKMTAGMAGYSDNINFSVKEQKQSVHTANWLPGPLYKIARKASKTNTITVMTTKTHINPRSTATEAPRRVNLPKSTIHHRVSVV